MAAVCLSCLWSQGLCGVWVVGSDALCMRKQCAVDVGVAVMFFTLVAYNPLHAKGDRLSEISHEFRKCTCIALNGTGRLNFLEGDVQLYRLGNMHVAEWGWKRNSRFTNTRVVWS